MGSSGHYLLCVWFSRDVWLWCRPAVQSVCVIIYRPSPFIPDTIRQPHASSAPTCWPLRQPRHSRCLCQGPDQQRAQTPVPLSVASLNLAKLLPHPLRGGEIFDESLFLPQQSRCRQRDNCQRTWHFGE